MRRRSILQQMPTTAIHKAWELLIWYQHILNRFGFFPRELNIMENSALCLWGLKKTNLLSLFTKHSHRPNTGGYSNRYHRQWGLYLPCRMPWHGPRGVSLLSSLQKFRMVLVTIFHCMDWRLLQPGWCCLIHTCNINVCVLGMYLPPGSGRKWKSYLQAFV